MLLILFLLIIGLSMAVAPAAITAGGGLAGGLLGNKGAQKAANSAAASRDKLVQRSTLLFDRLFGNAAQADQSGTFNYDHQLAGMESQGKRDLAVAQRVQSGNAMQAGARPGDSSVTQGADNLTLRYMRELGSMRDSLKKQSFWDTQNAYGTANAGLLSPGIQASMFDQQNAQSRMQNPAGLITNMMGALTAKAPSPVTWNFGALNKAVRAGQAFQGFW